MEKDFFHWAFWGKRLWDSSGDAFNISLKTSEDQASFPQEANACIPPLVHGQPLSSQATWWCFKVFQS